MKRNLLLIGLLLALSLLLVACGGGDGDGAPVSMTKHESEILTVEYPEGWNVDSMDMFGMSIIIASSADLEAEGLMESATPEDFFGDQGGIMIMSFPPEMAGADDMGFSEEELQEIENEPGVELVKKGDITIDGATGYELVAKGVIEDMGDQEMGVHIATLQSDAGQLVFMGISPEKDMDKNLDIFDYMLQSIKFAE